MRSYDGTSQNCWVSREPDGSAGVRGVGEGGGVAGGVVAGTAESENIARPAAPSVLFSDHTAGRHGAREEAREVGEEAFWAAPGADDGSVSPTNAANTYGGMQRAVREQDRTERGGEEREERETLVLEEYESDFEDEED